MKSILAFTLLMIPFFYLPEDEHGKAGEIVLRGIIRDCSGDTCRQKQVFPQQGSHTFILHVDEYGGFADTLIILRQDSSQKVTLRIPAGGTETDFAVEPEIHAEKYIVADGGGGYSQGPFPVALTGLPDGRYHLSYSSCNFWGGLVIDLRKR